MSSSEAMEDMEPAFYEEPPQPNQREWPAGALLPDTGVVRKWAWRTLQAAKEELQLAVESVMEDLEGLGATSCSLSSGQTHPASADGAGSSSSGSCYTSGAEEGGTDDDDEELSIRVNDLVPPVTRRAAYEMEWEEKPAVDEGFEVINWEDEMRAIRGPRNIVMPD